MVPLQLPGPFELSLLVFGLGLQLAIPAFVALVVYQFMDGRNAYEERIAAFEDEVAALRDELQ